MRIGLVGGGNMAQALIGGIAGRRPDTRFVVVEPAAATRAIVARLVPEAAVHESASADLAACDVIVFAVKPQTLRDAARATAPWIAAPVWRGLVVSIAAGIRTAEIGRWLGGRPAIVRAMPNTPALIGAGISALFANPATDAAQRRIAETLLDAVGQTLWVSEEAQLDAVTAVSGSGPAYVFAFIEALQAGALELGLSPDDARRLAVQTFVGASRLAAESEEPIEVLRERVTSKGGTTHAALTKMGEHGCMEAIVHAVHAAARRSIELGDEFGRD